MNTNRATEMHSASDVSALVDANRVKGIIESVPFSSTLFLTFCILNEITVYLAFLAKEKRGFEQSVEKM